MHLKISLVTLDLGVGILRQECHLLSIVRPECHGHFTADAQSGTIVDRNIRC